jgi:hypothetical protein
MLPKLCGGNSSSRINNDWGIIDNPGKRDLILFETGKRLPSTFQNGMSNSTQGIIGTKKRHNPLTLKISCKEVVRNHNRFQECLSLQSNKKRNSLAITAHIAIGLWEFP